ALSSAFFQLLRDCAPLLETGWRISKERVETLYQAVDAQDRLQVAPAMGVIHGRKEVGLLEDQAFGLAFEERHVVLEDALVGALGAALHRIADDRVQGEAARCRLLDEVKCE